MTNELGEGAEESATIEKTAIEQSKLTTDTAEAVSPVTPIDAAPVAEPADVPDPEVPSQPESVLDIAGEPAPPAPVETPQAQPFVPSTPIDTAPVVETQNSGEIDFGAILEQFEQEQTVFHSGELVSGTVVGISDRGVLVDFGYKSEGFVPVEEFTATDGELTVNVGETVEVVIRSILSGDGAPQLSRIDALGRKVWDEIEAAFQAETPVTGRVVDKTKGGLRIDLNGIEAFLPGSQIDSRPIRSLDTYIGQEIEARVVKFSRRRNNIVLSRKILTDEVVNVQKAETLNRIDVGYIVDGTIKNLTEYGAFVDIGGIDGLLHVTDMSWGRIHHPSDQFKVGDHIQVKVLKLDREKEKISLGYKQLLPDPWSTVVEVYPVNAKVKGIVSSVTEYGVFVELEPGVEGLVHVSEISWSRRSQSPKRLFHKGQEVEVQVLGVDTVEKRISLGMKQFQENPWDTVELKYPVGAKITGRVRNLTDFGAFIELEEGIDGLVHVSDISWAKKIKHPKDVLHRDQEVEAIVTSIDKRGQRLSLSMKDLTPSVWEGFVATHRPGDVVKGKVSRFTNFGIFVELGEGLEGLCHISELSDERVDRAESVAELGQEMDFKILRIEPVEQKIGLSHRAVGKEDEPVLDAKMYSSEAKGGMASLGELANLKFGEAAAEAPEDAEEKKKAKKAAKKAKADEFAAKEAETPAETVTAEPTAEAVVVEDSAPESGGEVANSPVAENGSAETPAPVVIEAEDVTAETPAPAVIEAEDIAPETPPPAVIEEEEEAPQAAEEPEPVAKTEESTKTEVEPEPEPAPPAEEIAEEKHAPKAKASEGPVAGTQESSEDPVAEVSETTEASTSDVPSKESKKKSAKRQN